MQHNDYRPNYSSIVPLHLVLSRDKQEVKRIAHVFCKIAGYLEAKAEVHCPVDVLVYLQCKVERSMTRVFFPIKDWRQATKEAVKDLIQPSKLKAFFFGTIISTEKSDLKWSDVEPFIDKILSK